MADLSVTAANALASTSAAGKARGTAGATITAGQAVYLDAATGTLKLAVKTSLAAAAAVGIALHGAASGQPLEYVYQDDDYTPGATLVAGTCYTVGATAGNMAPSADLASGNYATFMMIAKSTTKAILRVLPTGATV